MRITIYSTTTCPFCTSLKDYLKEKGVEYEEKMIDQDMVARKELQSKSDGYLGIPFVVIEKKGTENKVLGFNKSRIESILAS